MQLPDWAAALPLGHWYAISGDTPDLGLAPTPPGTRWLEDGDPALNCELNPTRSPAMYLRRKLHRYVKAPWSGRCDFSSITEAWNGGIYASNCGDSGSMVIFGGGHNDYFGSDVHKFDLATRQWQRISDGYISGASTKYGAGAIYAKGEYPDGSPLPPHTYGYVQYDADGNDLLLFKSQRQLGRDVQPLAIPHMFNLSREEWRRGPCHPTAYLGAGGFTAWDNKRRVLWGNSGNGSNCFLGFSPDGKNPDGSFGKWGKCFAGKLPGLADHCTMTYDAGADLLILVDHTANRLGSLDPGNPCEPMVHLTCADNPHLSAFAAIEYAPGLNSLVYYSACDGANIWRVWRDSLDANTWHRERLLSFKNHLNPVTHAAAQTQHAVHREHTFGRFRVASFDAMDLAVLVRHVDTPVYVIRIS